MQYEEIQKPTQAEIREVWEQAAENAATENVRGVYLTKLFLRPIEKGMEYLPKIQDDNKKIKKIAILKVDLWNEGIDFKRNILKHLVKNENALYGIDISYKTCSLAQQYTKGINVSQGTIDNLGFKPESFDMVLDLSTLDHLPQEKLPEVLAEYSRVLKSKGVFILVFDWWGIVWSLYMLYLKKVRGHKDYFFKGTNIPSRYIHPIKIMKKITEQNGFEIKNEYCIDYTGWTWNRVTKPFWVCVSDKWYDRILDVEYSGLSKWMRPFAKQYVVIAQKIK